MYFRELVLTPSREEMGKWPDGKFLIDTVNAHSFVQAQDDKEFEKALLSADALIPDGISIVKAFKWLKLDNAPKEKIAGADLFTFEMERLNKKGGCCFFMGSSPAVLEAIRERAAKEYPSIRIETFSPPFKDVLSEEDTKSILEAIHKANPDLLWIGMTAPKQEKWLQQNWSRLEIHCHTGAIGAVFDFFAGTRRRAPEWWLKHGLEWFYRLILEPKRMWKRVFVSGPRFMMLVLKEKFSS